MTNTNTKTINRKNMLKNIAIIALSVLSLILTYLLVFSQTAEAAQENIIAPEKVVEVEKTQVKIVYVNDCNHNIDDNNTIETDKIVTDNTIIVDDEIIDSENVDDLDNEDIFDEIEIGDTGDSDTIVNSDIDNNVSEDESNETVEPPVIIIPNDDEDDSVEMNGIEENTDDEKSEVESDVVIEEIIPEIIIPEVEPEILEKEIKDEKKEEVIMPEVPVVKEPVKSFTTTKFVTNHGDIIIEYDGENQELIDAVIHDILYFMINVEFDWNGEYATLTITGPNVVYYADRVEVNGVRIATLYGAEAFAEDNLSVIAMYTEFAN